MTKSKLSFAQAIAYMTENPGKAVLDKHGVFHKYEHGTHLWRFNAADHWSDEIDFDEASVKGQWTIPEPELPEIEVVGFSDDTGHIRLARRGSSEEAYLKDIGSYTKCKIKFNQGEE